MDLVKLFVISVLHVCLVGCQSTQSSQQASRPHPPSGGSSNLSFPWSRLRLPRYIIPIHYHLLLHPNLTSLSFTGSVQIQIDVQNNTNWVVLHSKGLQISKATILDQNFEHLSDQVLPVLHNPSHEQVGIFSPRVLSSGQKYFLYIEFGAELSEKFFGFYKSTYKTSTGETRVLASTHFEPTSARLAFPCFDEPSFKANFSVRIRRSPEFISLSNMPIVSLRNTLEISGGLLEDRFVPSVKMSTYLVAFVICDFKSVTATTSSGIQVSIYAAPEKWQQTHYALKVAVKMLDFFEEYFNIRYPLPKQDLIAIPDFQAGAMENWGLTTYRETSLLFDPLTSSVSDKLWVTMVIGHELAHQWFGNLVTMEWWNDIWLNEGFARYMEYIAVEATYPELKVEEYLLHTCFAAVGLDSLNSSRPISSTAENPTQIKEMFDTVSYDKGACVLHMLRYFLTDTVFQSGIVRYLRKYSYRNAHNQDLWDTLANVRITHIRSIIHSNVTMSQCNKLHMHKISMMSTWTLQKGIPLITVTRKGSKLMFRQDRFLRTVLFYFCSFLWHIPLTYKTDVSNAVHRHLMTKKTDSVHIGDDISWVKVNTDMTGYYVVHYEDGGWDEITKVLRENHTALSYKDRTHLIHNAVQLVTAGHLPLNKALDLIGYLQMETHTVPLLQGLGYLEAFYSMIERRNDHNLMHILGFFRGIIDQQTWSDSGSVLERRFRSEVLSLACHLNDQPCLEQAKQSFKNWLQSNGTLNLPTDVAETVFSVGAQDEHGWNSLFYTYTTSLSEAQKHKIMSALASTKDTNKLHRYIFFPLVFAQGLWCHHVAEEVISGTFSMQLFFESIKEQISELRAVQIALDNVQKNIRWMQRNLEPLQNWLNEQMKTAQ
uniref:Aminopeptidase n=1 Tax=Sphaeramia orbicularis TaxID=375764 RepID=A0A672YSZ3_9TELE